MDINPTPGYLLWRVATKWRVAVDRAVAPLGLTHAQYALVATLHGTANDADRPNQRQLADHIGLEPLFVSKLLRALERSGLVDRQPDPTDSRAVRVALTGLGRTVAGEAVGVVARLHDELMAPIGGRSSRDAKRLVATLQTLLATPLPPPD